MEINVINNVPNVKVTVNKSENGFAILLAEEIVKKLGDVKPGETVTLGNREYIVLGHGEDTTAVITKNFTTEMKFGENNDYRESNVRKYCNNEFYKELVAAVGSENIIQHTVRLTADDGTNKGVVCKDNVSILTTELYRRYREYLPAYGDWWWTATPVNSDDSDYSRDVCCVGSGGILSWGDCGCCCGVRPFCILNSSISIS